MFLLRRIPKGPFIPPEIPEEAIMTMTAPSTEITHRSGYGERGPRTTFQAYHQGVAGSALAIDIRHKHNNNKGISRTRHTIPRQNQALVPRLK